MTLADQRLIRILHVVGGMNPGGIETWLMHVLRNIDRDRFQIDFLVHTAQPCAYDDEIRSLGSKVIPCLYPSKPWLFGRNFKRIVREYGPYDIVHSHIHHFSGYILHLAHQAGIPVRIAHSHLDTSQMDARAGLLRRGYLNLMKLWIAYDATVGLAASRKAAKALFGSNWDTDACRRILYCSVELAPFHNIVDPFTVRAELGIPPDTFVIGHVGRFDEQKNHEFLLEIAAEIAKRNSKMRLLLIGHGPRRAEIEQKVAQMGLRDHVIFAGIRSDVPRLMLGAMDVFLLPSLYEGLPLVLIEAQAARLPCIFSETITEEVEVVKPLMQRMSLSQSASAWAEAVLAMPDTAKTMNPVDSLAILESSPFNIAYNLKALKEFYMDKKN